MVSIGEAMMHGYIRYDEIEDVLTSTDLLALIAPRLDLQPSYWKWMIVAAQNGLQGAIVCALHDAIGVSVLTDKSARAVLKWHEQNAELYPTERLADFLTLLRRFCRQNPAAKESVTRLQIRDIYRLHRHFRNGFEHFTPKSWSIETVGLPRIIGTALDFIEVAMRNEKVIYRLSGNKVRRLKENLSHARVALAACSLQSN